MKSKFLDVYTVHGKRTVNVDNIASIEETANGTKVILNIKDIEGNQIVYLSIIPITETTNIFLKEE